MTRKDTNIKPYWQNIRQMIKESDVVLHIVDARLIELSRNAQLEALIKEVKRPSILVVNKADLVSKRALEIGMDKLREEGLKDIVYVSNKRKNTVRNLLGLVKQMFEKEGKRGGEYREPYDKYTPKAQRKHREAKGEIIIGVFGYPNVGKSSIINALIFKKKAKVSSKAGTTHGAHWIGNAEIKFIDTPGVLPLEYNDEVRLGLIGSRNPEKLKNTDVVAAKILEMFLEKNKRSLEKFYNIKVDESLNSYEIIEAIALTKGHLKKGGVADESRTSTMIVKDWQQGNLRL